MARAATRDAGFGFACTALLAYSLCDLLHEAAHLAATLLPLGVHALSFSTVAVQTSQSNPIVAAAGPLANLVLAVMLLLVGARSMPATARYFAWLLGTLNLLNATGYLLYSAVSGGGDLAVALDALASPTHWRPLAGAAGLLGYAVAIRTALVALRRLVATGALASSQVAAACLVPYWSGALLLCAGAALNPISPWLVLTSGAATGFGAMAGLTALPTLFTHAWRAESSSIRLLRFGMPWLAAGVLAAIAFVVLFGPGVEL